VKSSQPLPGDQLAPGQDTPASADNDRGQDSKSDDALRETFRRVALARKSDASGPSGVPTRKAGSGLMRRWLLLVNLAFGVYAGLPWLAPVLMQTGQPGIARGIYLIYSTQCHQLPQRSFFLFGQKPMYSLDEIRLAWQDTNNPRTLRQFVGKAEMGWKVAWSDRMVSMYTGLFLAGLAFALVRRRIRPLPWWGFGLFLLPMAMDGTTHIVSDLAGLGQGFRDTNGWLAPLTGGALPTWFYVGDALGSFNSWMRLLTGLLFGVGAVWFGFPHLEPMARESGERSPGIDDVALERVRLPR